MLTMEIEPDMHENNNETVEQVSTTFQKPTVHMEDPEATAVEFVQPFEEVEETAIAEANEVDTTEPVNEERLEETNVEQKEEQVATSTVDTGAGTAAPVDVGHVKSPALIKEQLKHCATVFKGLKRHPQSSPFQTPVDPVALNIPDYFGIIKTPMDLSNIGRKLEGGEYADADHFVADVRLMLSNTFTYNHPDSQVAKMGHSLEKYFNTAIGKMPTTLPSLEDKKRKSGEDAFSAAAANRVRRESHAPARLATTPTTPRGRGRMSQNPEMQFCASTLRELYKKSNQTVAWPFLEPVDPVKLGIPDYFTIIKNPMDLSTVKKKLETGQYMNAEQFEADVRLIISNCMTYNAPESDVLNLCRGFERLFESKWSQKPSVFPAAAPSSNADDEDSDSEKILEINRQIQALQQELNTLLMRRRSKPSNTPRPRKPSTQPKSQTKTASNIITEEDFLSRPMTFEEKRQLSIQVNNLEPEKLGKVVEIIQSGMSLEAQGDSDVIELDIESLNVKTLRQLQKYVMECNNIHSFAAMLGEGNGAAKRKKSTSGPSAKKNSATPSATPATSAAAAAAIAMSSEDESSDEDLD